MARRTTWSYSFATKVAGFEENHAGMLLACTGELLESATFFVTRAGSVSHDVRSRGE
jgi:hypothetical protein